MKFQTVKLTPDDWQIHKTLRLAALKECEGMYLSSYQEGLKRTEEQWGQSLGSEEHAIFALKNNDDYVGIAAVFTWDQDPSKTSGVMAMDYILPDYRGKGLMKYLYEARIAWAIAHPVIKKLVISHREGNEPSRRAILAHGFEFTGKEKITFGDGQEDIEYNYERDISAL